MKTSQSKRTVVWVWTVILLLCVATIGGVFIVSVTQGRGLLGLLLSVPVILVARFAAKRIRTA